jgi:hypothetical protein
LHDRPSSTIRGSGGGKSLPFFSALQGEGQRCCDEAETARGKERRQIAVESRAREATAESSRRCAELVAGEDPSKDQIGPLATEFRRCQLTVGGTVANQSRP